MNYTLRSDLQTLLNRALKGKEVNIFGEDGNGRYARFAFPVQCAITFIEIMDGASTDEKAVVGFELRAGNRFIVNGCTISETHGRPDGDQNLKVSINTLLKAAGIPSNTWSYVYSAKTPGYDVVLEFDVRDVIDGA